MELVHVTDWLPTLVAAAGGGQEFSFDKPLDGVNQLSTLTNAAPSARTDVLINIERTNGTSSPCVGAGCASHPVCNGGGQYAVISGRHKLLLGGGGQPNTWYHDDLPYNGTQPVPQGGCLVACSPSSPDACPATPNVQLFDLFADVEERHDLAPANPDLVADLMKVLVKYNSSEYVDALFGDYDRFPVQANCPFKDANQVLTPC